MELDVIESQLFSNPQRNWEAMRCNKPPHAPEPGELCSRGLYTSFSRLGYILPAMFWE